jgi:hypothetical protein
MMEATHNVRPETGKVVSSEQLARKHASTTFNFEEVIMTTGTSASSDVVTLQSRCAAGLADP